MKKNISLSTHWFGELVALASGACLPFAFAPFGLFPVAVVIIAVLFWLWVNTAQKKRILWRAYLFGIGYFAVGVSWVSVSMVRFGGIPLSLAFFLTLLFVLILALYPTLVAFCYQRWFRNAKPVQVLLVVLPALWVLGEWIRSWFLSGFPWLALGYSQTDSPLSGVAPIIGVYGVSLLVAISSGALVLLYQMRGTARAVLIGGIAGGWVASGALVYVNWGADIDKPITASLIQGNIPQNIKWDPEQRRPTIDLYSELTRQHWRSDIVLWPETALPAFYHQALPFIESLRDEALQHNTRVMMGIPYMENSADNNKHYFNSLIVLNESIDIYHKYHLVPFGEFIPLQWLLGGLLDFFDIPMGNFNRSETHQPVLPVGALKAAISICYEDAFGEEVITGLPQANFLVNVSNDAWFGDSFAPHQHLQMARMRSIETARPMLRATNNGVSAIIDHKGTLTAVSPQFEQYVLTGSIQPRQGSTPYVLLGNYAIIFICMAGLLVIGFAFRTSA